MTNCHEDVPMPTVRTNGIQTYYEEHGDGPPVVFLHGAMSDHRLWAEQLQPLTNDVRVVVPDLRGHGRTGGSETVEYTIGLYADDLDAFITALDLDRPPLCGLSMGGMIAQTYAARSPETISALCTLSATTPELLTRGEWIERRLVPTAIETMAPLLAPDRLYSVVQWINQWRHDETANGDLAAEEIKRSHAEPFPETPPEEAEKIRSALVSYPDIDVDHGAITVPSLLLYGEREPPPMARHARYMAETIPTADARPIPDAGHHSHVDSPAFVVETLRGFSPTLY